MNSDVSLRVDRDQKTLRELTLEKMREAILEGQFKPGDRLVERTLCERLGVSRSVVREVLRHLEAEGLVEAGKGRGPEVARLDTANIQEIYEIRAMLEGMAARACAEKATASEIETLDAALARIHDAWARPERRGILAAVKTFYDCLFTIANRPRSRDIVEGLNARINRLRALTIATAGRRDAAVEEMDAIVAAIRRREGEAAAAAAIRHVEIAAALALAHAETAERPASVVVPMTEAVR